MSKVSPWLRRGFEVIAVLVLLVVGFQIYRYLEHEPEETVADVPEQDGEPSAPVVHVSQAKLDAVDLRLDSRRMELARTVPVVARIDFDQTRYVPVAAIDDLVIDRMDVTVGQQVAQGETVLVCNCPTVGSTRAEIRQRHRELTLLQQRTDRAQAIHDGLVRLLEYVRNGTPTDTLRANVAQESLGSYRARIIDLNAKAEIAAALLQQAQAPAAAGAIAGREVRQREANYESAVAELTSVCDESRFQVEQELGALQAELQRAGRAADLPAVLQSAGADAAKLESILEQPEDRLSEWVVRAPIDGTIVSLAVAQSQRVAHETVLFEVANLDHVWLTAWYRPEGGERPECSIEDSLAVRSVDDPDARATGNLVIRGPAFDPQARAWPLIVRLDNSDRTWVPGSLVSVDVPVESPRSVIAVPASAVMDEDGRFFVFVPAGDAAFRRVDVELDWRNDDWAVIAEGLDPGTQVVASAGFFLKSELLLEPEDE